MSGKFRTPLLIGAVALAVAVTGGWYVWWGADEKPAYVTATVERGRIVSTVTATGTLNPVTTILVGTYVSGRITAIDVDFNAPVTKGQRVAKIDPAPFLVRVQQAEANLATTRARVEKAQAELRFRQAALERQRRLHAKQVVSQDTLDAAVNSFEQAVAQLALDGAGVKEADAALAEARVNLDYSDIVSPVDGVVLSRNVDVGQTVAASFQTPTLFVIAEDLTKMQVNASVSESDIGVVRQGEEVRFTVDAYPARIFRGTVTQVRNDPLTVQNVVTYDVIIEVDNSDLALKPGMTATVTITTAERDDVVSVPLRAIRFRPTDAEETSSGNRADQAGSARAVWLLDSDGELRRVEVQTGIRSDEAIEIISDAVEVGATVALAYQRDR